MKLSICGLAGVLILVLVTSGAHAEPTSDSPLLNGLSKILRDPERKMTITNDKATVVVSKHGDISFGADGMARLHAPGTLGRMMKLTEGFSSVKVGEALGHRGATVKGFTAQFATLSKSKRIDFKLRSDPMGFRAKRYASSNRPMDIYGQNVKMTVCPSGRCTIKSTAKGPLGFGPPPISRNASAKKNAPVGRAKVSGISALKVTSGRRTSTRTSKFSSRSATPRLRK